MSGQTRLVWAPQAGPQKFLIDCPFSEIFFGGARGGGKTDGVLGKWALKEQRYGTSFNAIMFRRTTVSSDDAIERSKAIFGPLGGEYNESKSLWRMPNGGRVSFRYLEKITDADEYQGRNVTDAWVEEAGQFADSAPIDRLYGVLRSAEGVPVQLILTANPGGAGQHWLAERYKLIPFPSRPQIVSRELPNGKQHRAAVIPSRITDNKIMLRADPGYLDRLQLVGSDALVRAWLDGDWSAIEGAFFDQWSKRNVVAPFDIPQDWHRFRSGDWGFAKPFSVGWWAVASDDLRLGSVTIPRGSMVRYREWYGSTGKPNVGLRLTAEEVADGIKEREAGEVIGRSVLDPAAFSQDGGPSIAERMSLRGVYWNPADNKRVSKAGAMGGWDMMRARIKGDLDGPRLFVFNTCRDFLRTVPTLQHDPNRSEDLDTESEDHAADEARYGCMSRPWTPPKKQVTQATVSGYVRAETGRRDETSGLTL